jgi:hypothetical protein
MCPPLPIAGSEAGLFAIVATRVSSYISLISDEEEK